MKVCHVVRQFGVVGGMERYVWNLCHELVKLGMDIVIICEEVIGDPDPRLQLIIVPKSSYRRRYKQMESFRRQVDFAFHHFFLDRLIIHSHERSLVHDLSTFHGPLYRTKSMIGFSGARSKFWKKVERSEICLEKCQFIIPVSELIGRQLRDEYECCANKVLSAGYPGVSEPKREIFIKPTRVDSVKLIFVGRDWKRKGLEQTLQIFNRFRDRFDGIVTLDVYGPGKEVEKLVKKYNANWCNWCSQIDFHKYDVLILPAKIEPFGMVVLEALLAGCRVLCSDQVGALELVGESKAVSFRGLGDDLAEWNDSLVKLLQQSGNIKLPQVQSWSTLAEWHVNFVYRALMN